eukprot:363127-Chlamydomonas_euryale.AAC.9
MPNKQCVATMPGGSVIKQLSFAEGLVGLGQVVGRPLWTWLYMPVAALSPVLTFWLAGWGWYEVAQDRALSRALCDSAQPQLNATHAYDT